LGGLFAAREKDNLQIILLNKVLAIASPIVHSQFGNALVNRLHIAWIAKA